LGSEFHRPEAVGIGDAGLVRRQRRQRQLNLVHPSRELLVPRRIAEHKVMRRAALRFTACLDEQRSQPCLGEAPEHHVLRSERSMLAPSPPESAKLCENLAKSLIVEVREIEERSPIRKVVVGHDVGNGHLRSSRTRPYMTLSRHAPARKYRPRSTPSRRKPTRSSARCSATLSSSVPAWSRWAGRSGEQVLDQLALSLGPDALSAVF